MGPRTDSLPEGASAPSGPWPLISVFLSLCSLPRSPPPWAPSCGIRFQSPQWGGTGLSGPFLLASFLPVALELAGFQPLEIWGVTRCWSRCSQTPAPAPLLPWEAAPHFPFWAASSRTET